MRKRGVILLFSGLLLAWPVLAQDRTSVFSGGLRPQAVTMKPMDTTRVMTPPQMSRYPSFSPHKPMSGTSFFPKLSFGNWPPRLPTPSVVSGKNNVFQPTPPKGKNPFDVFLPKK
jgi:hypothetical protein